MQGARPILFNTMPKSGSIYITRWLMAGLGVPETKIGVCLFPDDLVIRDKLDEFAGGGFVCQQHLPAREINLRFLSARLDRMVVHVRNPRQATLSWTHHLDTLYRSREASLSCRRGIEAATPSLPAGYFEWALSAKLDWQIENHFPLLIEWTRGWLKANGLPKLFTTYEEFVEGPDVFIERILEWFGITSFDWSKIPDKTPQTHFRKGEIAEWESTFSGAQIAASVIPPDLSEKFGWR